MLPHALYRFIRTGIVHPYAAYNTYKAYAYKDLPTLEVWLVYWMVMAAFMAVEMFADIIMSWLPFYSAAKLAILIWLTALRTQGSTVIFREIIHPHLAANETKIDQTLEIMQSHAKTALYVSSRRGMALLENLIGIAIERSDPQSHGFIESYLLKRAASLRAAQPVTRPSLSSQQKYKRKPLPPVQRSASQPQVQRFEFVEARKYLSPPEYLMRTPQPVSPPRTPSPNPYMRSSEYLSPQDSYQGVERGQSDSGYENEYRAKKVYQRVRKSSDVWSDRQFIRDITHAPSRSQSAMPHAY